VFKSTGNKYSSLSLLWRLLVFFLVLTSYSNVGFSDRGFSSPGCARLFGATQNDIKQKIQQALEDSHYGIRFEGEVAQEVIEYVVDMEKKVYGRSGRPIAEIDLETNHYLIEIKSGASHLVKWLERLRSVKLSKKINPSHKKIILLATHVGSFINSTASELLDESDIILVRNITELKSFLEQNETVAVGSR